MTLGWNKESKIISYGYLAKEVNLDKRNVRRAVSLLVQAKVIIKNKTGRKNMLGINQFSTSWELWKTRVMSDNYNSLLTTIRIPY